MATIIKIQDKNTDEVIIRKNDKLSVTEIKEAILQALSVLDMVNPTVTVKGAEV